MDLEEGIAARSVRDEFLVDGGRDIDVEGAQEVRGRGGRDVEFGEEGGDGLLFLTCGIV